MSLFEPPPPLAARLRPKTLDEVVGQSKVLGPGTILRKLIERDELRSVILWGPPGTGKTTIAHLVAAQTKSPVEKLSAVSSGVADVRKVIAAAKSQGRTILFIDEIHRFNRSQQDALLNAVEDGVVVLIGATTENPFFEVNSPLISRSLLFRLEPLGPDDLRTILVRGLQDLGASADGQALDYLASRTGGDARSALNALEAAAAMSDGKIGLEHAEAALEKRVIRYDKAGDRHYDVISAFIKSLRGSDVDASLWYLAEMLEAGEDARFIARRMIILASEDVGLADPNALVVAVAGAHALEHVGLPEAALNLAQVAVYLALAPKSNAVMRALGAASSHVREQPGEVPSYLRGSVGSRTKGYKYPHDYPGNFVEQRYRPEEAGDRVYWQPEGHVTEIRTDRG